MDAATPHVSAPPHTWTAEVRAVRFLSDTGFELTFSRDGLDYQPGQLVNLNLPGRDPLDERSYTVCSGARDPDLQVLVRLMPGGNLSPALARLREGDALTVTGPLGEFTVRDPSRPCWFIATGTGIAPARAYLRSGAAPDLTVLHGVRHVRDLFYREVFAGIPYVSCVSGEDGGMVRGRVTEALDAVHPPPEAHYYLCGANEMIYDVRDRLLARGVSADAIFTEAYYYRADD